MFGRKTVVNEKMPTFAYINDCQLIEGKVGIFGFIFLEESARKN